MNGFVVDALARRMWELRHEPAPPPLAWEDITDSAIHIHMMRAAREFLLEHQLMQLPSEPAEWEVERTPNVAGEPWISPHHFGGAWSRDEVTEKVRQHSTLTGRVRPVYRICGTAEEA